MYSIFVESIKRLYRSKKITAKKVTDLFQNNKITEDEKEYILSDL